MRCDWLCLWRDDASDVILFDFAFVAVNCPRLQLTKPRPFKAAHVQFCHSRPETVCRPPPAPGRSSAAPCRHCEPPSSPPILTTHQTSLFTRLKSLFLTSLPPPPLPSSTPLTPQPPSPTLPLPPPSPLPMPPSTPAPQVYEVAPPPPSSIAAASPNTSEATETKPNSCRAPEEANVSSTVSFILRSHGSDSLSSCALQRAQLISRVCSLCTGRIPSHSLSNSLLSTSKFATPVSPEVINPMHACFDCSPLESTYTISQLYYSLQCNIDSRVGVSSFPPVLHGQAIRPSDIGARNTITKTMLNTDTTHGRCGCM